MVIIKKHPVYIKYEPCIEKIVRERLVEEKEKDMVEKQGTLYVLAMAITGKTNLYELAKINRPTSSVEEEKALNGLYESFNRYIISVGEKEKSYTLKVEVENKDFLCLIK